MKKQPKILISIDESIHSVDMLRFLAENRSFHSSEMTLFHVLANLPQALQDTEDSINTGLDQDYLEEYCDLIRQKTVNVIEREKHGMLEAGIKEKNIRVKVVDKTAGIARDIIAEAASGYNLLIIGRRGMGKLQQIFLGSVSAKLLEKASFLPIMVMGSLQPKKKIFIAFDGSDCAWKAVKFVGDVMGTADYSVTLIHVLRMEDGARSAQVVELILSQNWYATAERKILAKMNTAKADLIKAGLAAEKIDLLVVRDEDSRAGAIVKEADRNGPGIIVMGRRGLSRVEEFIMGRVSNKVIQMTKTSTICIVPELYPAADT